MPELKKCPFCGSKDIEGWLSNIPDLSEPFTIRCQNCGVKLTGYDRYQATIKWNRRDGEK